MYFNNLTFYRRLAPREFNSYGSRRGNDAVMARGTFANIRLVNKFIGKAAPRTLHFPSGDTVRWKLYLDSCNLFPKVRLFFPLWPACWNSRAAFQPVIRFLVMTPCYICLCGSTWFACFRCNWTVEGSGKTNRPKCLPTRIMYVLCCRCFERSDWVYPTYLWLMFFYRWTSLMQLNATSKRDANSLSWPARIMGQDRHVTGLLRGPGCR